MICMDGSSMIGSPIVIADSERDMPGIEPGPLGWHTSPRDTRSKATQRPCINTN